MHPEAWAWLEAEIRPLVPRVRRVLDLGGCDVNGSPRALFPPEVDYCVLDARSGPNVHIVADAVTWLPPRPLRGAFDMTLSTEVFEHVQHWRAVLYNLWLTLKPAGTCLVTCATHPRPPHSIVGVEPPPAGEWYGNVAPEDLLAPMRLLFRDVEWRTHPRGDLYARGLR